MTTYHDVIRLQTSECLQFIDLTDLVTEFVQRSGIQTGIVNVQTKHTTTAIVVNENEPLLLGDMKQILERMAPQYAQYQHNNFSVRTVNVNPFEDDNGHSHCKALLLGTSETLNIVDAKIQLGRWQRIFFIELDKAKERAVSLMVLGY